MLGGGLAFGVAMIVGFLVLVLWNGLAAFYPGPIALVQLTSGDTFAGEPVRSEPFEPPESEVATLSDALRAEIADNAGMAVRTLYRIGNFDLYGEDFRWVPDHAVASITYPPDYYHVERLEWGPFIGRILRVNFDGLEVAGDAVSATALHEQHGAARERWRRLRSIVKGGIGEINREIEGARLDLRRAALRHGVGAPEYAEVKRELDATLAGLEREYATLAAEAARLKALDERFTITFVDGAGSETSERLSSVVRMFPANDLGLGGKLGVYLSRWGEFVGDEPREANTEGGVLPAIFGTAAMTLLLVVFVAPFGVITALYLREYARQGRLVSIVRVSVNNLAGVPSIVYGVFGLGFFAYIVGANIDTFLFAERLPSPTFGTGGLLWASLTLALLTVPVVIVATEEALAAVPRSMREGSLACGASKWQTIRRVVLPRAMPGVLTGLILAMARGAGEVAPLMLVGVVKLAPELPIDGVFPFLHLERSFMHLGFHIYDVGFQSRNSEAGKPMVFVTTLLLIALIALMNAGAIIVRNRLKRRYAVGHF
ncbi:MAG: phosphate ABC transporter permease PstA [Alphaproteobacteria bacterium]|nr:phosphate ABC transporter permease PstA [Alphaproteobacteria bacterium]